MKHLVGVERTQPVNFMDDELQVRLLSVNEVLKLQKQISGEEDSLDNLDTMVKIIKAAVVGADELTPSQIKDFPLADLLTLVEEVMKVSGLKAEEGN